MSEAKLIEVIKTTLKTTGKGVDGDPVHRHTQYWNTDGTLLWEDCDGGFCDE